MTLENGGALVMARGAQRLGGARGVPGLYGWDWAGQHLARRGERCVVGKGGIR